MRVFVVGTGRCGTSTFYQAAKSIEGYTCGHESEAARIPSWTFPDNHVEVAAQLVYAIPLVLEKYPDSKWVHLIREREACVDSLAHQVWASMAAFAQQWFMCDHPADVVKTAAKFYDMTNALIPALVPEKQLMTIHLETLRRQWPDFCTWIGARYFGDVVDEVFEKRFNPGNARGRDNWLSV